MRTTTMEIESREASQTLTWNYKKTMKNIRINWILGYAAEKLPSSYHQFYIGPFSDNSQCDAESTMLLSSQHIAK